MSGRHTESDQIKYHASRKTFLAVFAVSLFLRRRGTEENQQGGQEVGGAQRGVQTTDADTRLKGLGAFSNRLCSDN